MASSVVVAVDIGTTRLIGAAGYHQPDGSVHLVAVASHAMTGLRSGIVIDAVSASQNLEALLSKLSKEAEIDISNISLLCTCGDVQCAPVHYVLPVTTPDGTVDQDVMDKLREQLDQNPAPAGRQAIAKTVERWELDGGARVKDPAALRTGTLGLGGLVVHTDLHRLDSMLDVVETAHVNCSYEDCMVPAMAAAYAGLDKSRQEAGALVLDLGGGTTSWCAYHNGFPISVGALPIGGDHVTNDLLAGFSPGSTKAAEEIKLNYGNAILDGIDPSARVPLPVELGRTARTGSLRSIAMVVNARLDETLCIVQERLQKEDVLDRLGGGIVLTGNAAKIPGIETLVSRIFGKPCGRIHLKTGYEAIDSDPADTAAVWGGLVQAARREFREQHMRRPFRFLSKMVRFFTEEETAQ